jgi:DNA adenine methylase
MVSSIDKTIAKPFLKWAGGKTQLLDEIEKRLPKEITSGQINSYVEPFIGGGAVFFYMAQNYPSINHFYLFDINNDLVNCYKTIQSNVGKLIDALKKLESNFLLLNHTARKNFYLDIRASFNQDKCKKHSPETIAKMIFLNKTCFNGLYRVNSKNEFNVPFGDYKNPKICNEKNLLAVSQVLQKAEIICGDFEKSEKYINEKTFVYLDPPYRPLNKTANFTSYTKDSFSENDQIRLVRFCKEVKQKGAKFLLSNSDPKNENPKDLFFEKHYPQKEIFTIETVKASRLINCQPTKRGQINELLITNYK